MSINILLALINPSVVLGFQFQLQPRIKGFWFYCTLDKVS